MQVNMSPRFSGMVILAQRAAEELDSLQEEDLKPHSRNKARKFLKALTGFDGFTNTLYQEYGLHPVKVPGAQLLVYNELPVRRRPTPLIKKQFEHTWYKELTEQFKSNQSKIWEAVRQYISSKEGESSLTIIDSASHTSKDARPLTQAELELYLDAPPAKTSTKRTQKIPKPQRYKTDLLTGILEEQEIST